MATTETFVHGRLYQIPLTDLQPDPNQPRKNTSIRRPSTNSPNQSTSKEWSPIVDEWALYDKSYIACVEEL
jgi:hypothetical protein